MAYKQGPGAHTRIDKQGRLVIPAEIRRELGLKPGEPISLFVEDGELRVMTLRRAVGRVQALAREVTGGRKGIVDEFLAERRKEAERE